MVFECDGVARVPLIINTILHVYMPKKSESNRESNKIANSVKVYNYTVGK